MSNSDRARFGRKGMFSGTSEKAWISAAVGLAILLVPPLLPNGADQSPLAVGLRPFGWLALGIGVLFVVAQMLMYRPPSPANEASEPEDPPFGMTRPSVLQALGIGRGDRGVAEVEPMFIDTIAVYEAEKEGEGATAARETSWSPRVFKHIDWRNFEAVCQAFFAQAGFATSSQGHGADGGVDIWLQSRHMPAPRIVRCRHWEGQPVNVKELRDFLGVMTSQGLQHGTYVTSSGFAPDAVEFAKANGIQMQDGATLLKLIAHRTQEQQDALLDIAYAPVAVKA
ncbi:restriction endonuclease [Variovorax sp. J22R133]|uniref:restriction endonuclease n=1 Tax=Variovorax brevis TaxID=3053503 RepID=UPI0025765445|nr:restriction endonuclease [Variovorax sp. J22R133]MDM0113354.1 restriction endonuclease [Variovorax sp. J22R133]